MVQISRRVVISGAGAVLAAPVISRSARAAEVTLKFANNASVDHPVNIRGNQVADRIKAETNGRVEMQVYANSQLGSDTDMLSQLRSGALEMMTMSGLILSILVPAASINGIGFAFPDYPTVWKAMDGDLGAYVRGQIGKFGLVAMDRMWDNGFRQLTTSSKPVRTQRDLDGMKIRVPISPLWTSMFKALGSSPTGISFSEVYSALQTGVVDGQEQALAVIDTSKLYEVQKYCAVTNHMWDGYWWLVNRRTWDAIPADLRTIVARNINQGALDERNDVATLNAGLQATLEKKGLIFNSTGPETFIEALRKAKFYEEWKGKYGDEAWALLEKSTGKLT